MLAKLRSYASPIATRIVRVCLSFIFPSFAIRHLTKDHRLSPELIFASLVFRLSSRDLVPRHSGSIVANRENDCSWSRWNSAFSKGSTVQSARPLSWASSMIRSHACRFSLNTSIRAPTTCSMVFTSSLWINTLYSGICVLSSSRTVTVLGLASPFRSSCIVLHPSSFIPHLSLLVSRPSSASRFLPDVFLYLFLNEHLDQPSVLRADLRKIQPHARLLERIIAESVTVQNNRIKFDRFVLDHKAQRKHRVDRLRFGRPPEHPVLGEDRGILGKTRRISSKVDRQIRSDTDAPARIRLDRSLHRMVEHLGAERLPEHIRIPGITVPLCPARVGER